MRAIVETFKRMYAKGTLSKETLLERVEKGTISEGEYRYIVGEPVE